MEINNGTSTPADTRVTSGGSGMGGYSHDDDWRSLQPGETLHFDLKGAGPWTVEFRAVNGGRRNILKEVAQTPHDLVELLEANGRLNVRIGRPRNPPSR